MAAIGSDARPWPTPLIEPFFPKRVWRVRSSIHRSTSPSRWPIVGTRGSSSRIGRRRTVTARALGGRRSRTEGGTSAKRGAPTDDSNAS